MQIVQTDAINLDEVACEGHLRNITASVVSANSHL
jgi:hypothetical protein